MSSEGIRTWKVTGERFILDSKYDILDYLGAGAYGIVCAITDKSDDRKYAVKKCKKVCIYIECKCACEYQ